ncbi:MAG: glutamate--tRNA ligase [Candidatus Thermoplasmatota archaeon]|nr:glutamate--tRNA ligase [Candidatus Thermoplasmatota archaeon]
MSEDRSDLIKKYALRNAVKFDGEATVGAVMGKVMGESEECREDPEGTKELVNDTIEEVNALSLEEQKEELEDLMPEFFEEDEEEEEERLPRLDADEVKMRMAPYPSGPLHIGNARMVILNDEYVKRNDGELVLFYDDTIGSETKQLLPDAYDMIKEGLEWLDVEWHETHYKSERMETYYEYGKKILEMGEAYVCECDQKTLQEKRRDGKECEHRDRPKEKNLELWEMMLEGEISEGEAVVRLKTDMDHPDPAFRDRVLFRISEKEHPRVGNEYTVWPLLEFSWAIDDHLLGMTHILRGKDLVIEDRMEEYIWDLFGWEKPEFLHYGMLRLENVNLSKSEFQQKVKNDEFKGWDDPRTWSMQSLKRRGIQPEAIRDFILEFGMSETDIEVPPSKLYAKNRELIDSEANRYFFIPDPVGIELVGDLEMEKAKISRHPSDPDRGYRELDTKKTVFIPRKEWNQHQNEEVRLKNFCNIQLEGKEGKITGYENKDILKIQWLSDGIDVQLEYPDMSVKEGIGENNLDETKKGDIIQFERIGFVKIEKSDTFYAVYGHR